MNQDRFDKFCILIPAVNGCLGCVYSGDMCGKEHKDGELPCTRGETIVALTFPLSAIREECGLLSYLHDKQIDFHHNCPLCKSEVVLLHEYDNGIQLYVCKTCESIFTLS